MQALQVVFYFLSWLLLKCYLLITYHPSEETAFFYSLVVVMTSAGPNGSCYTLKDGVFNSLSCDTVS